MIPFYRGEYGFLEDLFSSYRPILSQCWHDFSARERRQLRTRIDTCIHQLAREPREEQLLRRRYLDEGLPYRSIAAAAQGLGYPNSQQVHRRIASFFIRLRQHPLAKPWIQEMVADLKRRYCEAFPASPLILLIDAEATCPHCHETLDQAFSQTAS